MTSDASDITQCINKLKKDASTWNGVRTSFATALQEWDSISQEDMDMIAESSSSLFPIKESNYASSAYDIRESIMNKGHKVIKTLEMLRNNTEETLSTFYSIIDSNREYYINNSSSLQSVSLTELLTILENYRFAQLENFTLILSIVQSLNHKLPQDTIQTYVLSLKYSTLNLPLE